MPLQREHSNRFIALKFNQKPSALYVCHFFELKG